MANSSLAAGIRAIPAAREQAAGGADGAAFDADAAS